jgi:hypothetical protein
MLPYLQLTVMVTLLLSTEGICNTHCTGRWGTQRWSGYRGQEKKPSDPSRNQTPLLQSIVTTLTELYSGNLTGILSEIGASPFILQTNSTITPSILSSVC